MSQSQIDDGDISSDKLRNEYIMGRIEYRKLKITLGNRDHSFPEWKPYMANTFCKNWFSFQVFKNQSSFERNHLVF